MMRESLDIKVNVNFEKTALSRDLQVMPQLRDGRGGGGWAFYDGPLVSTGEQKLSLVSLDGKDRQRPEVSLTVRGLNRNDVDKDLIRLGLRKSKHASRSSPPGPSRATHTFGSPAAILLADRPRGPAWPVIASPTCFGNEVPHRYDKYFAPLPPDQSVPKQHVYKESSTLKRDLKHVEAAPPEHRHHQRPPSSYLPEYPHVGPLIGPTGSNKDGYKRGSSIKAYIPSGQPATAQRKLTSDKPGRTQQEVKARDLARRLAPTPYIRAMNTFAPLRDTPIPSPLSPSSNGQYDAWPLSAPTPKERNDLVIPPYNPVRTAGEMPPPPPPSRSKK